MTGVQTCALPISKKPTTSDLFAIKIIDCNDNATLSLIKHEVTIQEKFIKFGIAPAAFDSIITETAHYFPVELMDGCSLREQLRKIKLLKEDELVNIGLFIVDALIIMSSQQIVHNGIRPSQILVRTELGKPIYKISGFRHAVDKTSKENIPIVINKSYASPEIIDDPNLCSKIGRAHV